MVFPNLGIRERSDHSGVGWETAVSWLAIGELGFVPDESMQRNRNGRDGVLWGWILLIGAQMATHPAKGQESIDPTYVRPGESAREMETNGKRAFVCITGQIHRLELEGKIENLFDTLARTHSVDLAFVLSVGKAAFVVKRSQSVFQGNGTGPYATFSDVRRKLRGKFGLVQLREIQQVQSPILNPDYVDVLDKAGADRSLREDRSKSHVRQWSSNFHCLDMMDRFERYTGTRYDIVMRMREDLHVLYPIDFSLLLEDVYENMLIVQKCDSWGGVNDKIAIFARSSAIKYFTSPLLQFYLHPQEMLHTDSSLRVKNPETFLRKSYERAGLTIVLMEASRMLGIPVRRLSDTETCFPLGERSMRCFQRQLTRDAAARLLHNMCPS